MWIVRELAYNWVWDHHTQILSRPTGAPYFHYQELKVCWLKFYNILWQPLYAVFCLKAVCSDLPRIVLLSATPGSFLLGFSATVFPSCWLLPSWSSWKKIRTNSYCWAGCLHICNGNIGNPSKSFKDELTNLFQMETSSPGHRCSHCYLLPLCRSWINTLAVRTKFH